MFVDNVGAMYGPVGYCISYPHFNNSTFKTFFIIQSHQSNVVTNPAQPGFEGEITMSTNMYNVNYTLIIHRKMYIVQEALNIS